MNKPVSEKKGHHVGTNNRNYILMSTLKGRFILALIILVLTVVGCQKQENEEVEIIIPQLDGEVIFVQGSRVRSANINSISEATIYEKAGYDSYPKWSNDGTKFAYIDSESSTESNRFLLKIIDSNTGNLSEWEIGKSKYIIVNNQLSWSPNDKTVIFLKKGSSQQNTIIYLNTLTGDTVQSRFNIKYNEHCSAVAWNPTNGKIAVNIDKVESYHHQNSIWMIDPYENTPVKQIQIEAGWGAVEYMDWNFDGTKLIYSLGSYGDIFVTDVDGSDNYEIPEIYGLAPCWSKDDKLIMYQGSAGLDGSTIIPGVFVSDVNGSFEKLLLKNAKNPDWY